MNFISKLLVVQTICFIYEQKLKVLAEEASIIDTEEMIDHERYVALCNGQEFQPLDQLQDTYICFYTSNEEAFFILQPLKIEMLHYSPMVVQIHDLINEREAQELKNISEPNLKMAAIVKLDSEEKREVDNEQRVSKTTFLRLQDGEIVPKLYERSALVTRLSTDRVEAIQIAQYGPGGFYVEHHDYMIVDRSVEEQAKIGEWDLLAGDRTATLMVYLNDVDKGGFTAFPTLGIAVRPKKYSAVFWFNLLSNGNGDVLSLHGGCPIIEGEKWLANIWFRQNGQMFKRPCSLDSQE